MKKRLTILMMFSQTILTKCIGQIKQFAMIALAGILSLPNLNLSKHDMQTAIEIIK